MKKYLLTAGAIAIAATGFAQTRTVAATGADHTTIADALAFFSPDPDALTDNVIQITDNGVYDELLTVSVPVTIEGTGVDRPVITAQNNSGSDGLIVDLDPTGGGGSVILRNLIILPSLTSTPADDLLRAQGTLGVLDLTLENLLITANNGSNVPVTTDGLSPVDLTGATVTGDDGAFLAGTGTVVTMTDVIISHNQNGGGNDGLVCSGSSGSYTINDGCVFSYNGRLGIQANGTDSFVIDAPSDRVIVVGNLGFAGIWFAGPQTTERSIDGANVMGSTGFGMENQNRGVLSTDADGAFTNMVIANNGGEGLVIGSVGTTNSTYSNITIAGNGAEAIEVAGTSAGDLTFTDCIIAGNGTANADNVILHDGVGTLAFNNCGIVTSGPQALLSATPTGGGAVTTSAVINDDPAFVTLSDPSDPTLANVQDDAYETASSTASGLGGGGQYVGPPSSSSNWTRYQ